MTPSSPTRRFSRFPVQVPIRCQPQAGASSPPASGWTRNLSEGGACLELNEVLKTGTRVRLWLFTEGGSFPVDAHVVWKAPEPSGSTLHGVAFAALTPAQVEALRHLLAAATATTRADPRLPVNHPITCRLPDPSASVLVGETANVSRGGLALRLSLALPIGTPVQFSLQSPQGPITGTGEVVWAAADPGGAGQRVSHGIRFTALGWAHTWSLALLVTGTGDDPSGQNHDALPAP